jgi:peptidoglycan/xylan/chitin deacetylase (PgdA/CDA1 family)
MLRSGGVGALAAAIPGYAGSKDGVLVLAYHRIGQGVGCEFDPDVFSATPEAFTAQVRLLKSEFDVISPVDLPRVLSRGRGSYALITFDDGYRDNYEVAYPILRAAHVPATFFVNTGFLDEPRIAWWDEIAWMIRVSRRRGVPPSRWRREGINFDETGRNGAIRKALGCYKSLPGDQAGAFVDHLAEATGSGRWRGDARGFWMTWDMLREMKAGGMCIGGHTVSHPILSRLPRSRQEQEIAGCKQRIERELKEPMRFFAYPRGKPDSFNEDTRRCLKEHGVELAFSFYGGFQRFAPWQPYDVHRTGVEMEMGLDQFARVVRMPRLFA